MIWPLAQIGPGIMTVNDTEGYTWREFRSRVSSVVKVLFESYLTDIKELIPVRAQLTYINAISFDQTKESMTRFLRDRLHISIAIEPQLFEDRSQAEKPTELNLNLAFPLDKPSGSGILRVSNGRKNEESALVWQIVIRSADAQVPRDPSSLDIWLEDAHKVAETWFFTLVRGELLKTFESNDGNNNG